MIEAHDYDDEIGPIESEIERALRFQELAEDLHRFVFGRSDQNAELGIR